MLTTLRIQNLAIVDALEVEFGPGLNVVTGETGAGKSILVDALQLVLGGRAQADAIRAGTDEAVVEAHFQGPGLEARLTALGLPPANELAVRRTLSRTGRGRVSLNGALSTVAMLAQVGRGLVDLSGQHEHVTLLDVGTHLTLLDAFAGLGDALAEYRERFEALRVVHQSRAALALDEAERLRRVDYLAYQVRELEALQARPGEEAELQALRKRLGGIEKLRAAGAVAHERLVGGEGGAVEQAARALASMQDALAIDGGLEIVAQGIRAGLVELEESARALGRHLHVLEAQPERLLEIEERLEQLRHLARKHGCAADALPERLEATRAELGGLEKHQARLAGLDAEIARAESGARDSAQRLGERRRAAAERFARAVRKELAKLAMPEIRFEVSVSARELGPTGSDSVELRIGPNPGEPLLPLGKVASGGELSRALLGIKRALAEADPVSTYVFDEVDAGIGGAVAAAVGRMLQAVAGHRQVLCVTHLPQVASFADHHLVVRKQVQRGRTVSAVARLTSEGERRSELARMLGGESVTAAALEHARQLLAGAQREEGGVLRRPTRRAARRVSA